MNFNTMFHAAVQSWLRRTTDEDVCDVVTVEQDTRTGGMCSTCEWTKTVIVVHYYDRHDERQTYEWTGDMAELIRALDQADQERDR